MPFFGLVWMTSWVSCFLASSQGVLKVPDSIVSALPTKVFSVVSSPIELPHPRFVLTQLDSGVWSFHSSNTTFPNRGFQMSADTFQFRTQPPPAILGSQFKQNATKKAACPPQLDSKQESQSVKSKARSTRENRSAHTLSNVSLSQQLLQVMQNLLPWHQRINSEQKAFVESVEVVSTQAEERLRNKKNSTGGGFNRGFWHYSQFFKKRTSTAPTSREGEQFQVWAKGKAIAQFPTQQQAELMAQSLKQLSCYPSDSEGKTLSIEASLLDGIPGINIGDRLWFKIDDTLAKNLVENRELLAIKWANNLRLALGQEPLKLAEAQKRIHELAETSSKIEGLASWYGPYFHGRMTATGETYNQHELTAAHPTLPFNTYLKVRNLENGHSVIVRINDRGPYVSGRSLDLSLQAARSINSEKMGIVPFEAIIMKPTVARSQQE